MELASCAVHTEKLKMLWPLFSLLCIAIWSPANWSPGENLWERSLRIAPQLSAGQRADQRSAWSSMPESTFKPSISFKAAAEAVGMQRYSSSFPTRNGLGHLHLFPSSLHLTVCVFHLCGSGADVLPTTDPRTNHIITNLCKMDDSQRRLNIWNWWQSANCCLKCNGDALVMGCDHNQRAVDQSS